MKRFLGIDYGAKRIGLATGDDETKLAQPLATVGAAELLPTIEREGPFAAIVVGLPRSLDGAETPQTLAVRRFTDDQLGALEAEVVFQDEAGTSSVAEERLRQSGRPYQREQIDAEAAALILQDYLDAL
ncbi:MAG TPA: Holliday junction resolvase RuvX [Candidatus Saccharimonadia bacterium]|nr:Holliday junction resolvase RuvX [Candidatus Saccharimonadia bacterium]